MVQLITHPSCIVPGSRDDHVVLLDARGNAIGIESKASVHGPATPLHLGFSCHVVDRRGRSLITRRAETKRTWPGTWTNACCGHPLSGETLREAVTRRLSDELGVRPTRMTLAIPDFVYRAVMNDGTVEHEVCPVVVAEIEDAPRPSPDEVATLDWVEWDALVRRARERPQTLTPWSVSQVLRLAAKSPAHCWLLDAPRFAGLDAPAAPAWPRTTTRRANLDDPFLPVRERLAVLLESFLAARTRELLDLSPALEPIAREISGLVTAGGKRLRPAFVHWGARAGGVAGDEGSLAVAGAIELLHTFALLHDDVMDRSDSRRGRPTAWRTFADARASDCTEVDAEWFGWSAAILTGDLAFVWADQMFDAAPVPEEVLAKARRVYNTLRVEVMAGQYLDLYANDARVASEDEAHRIALLKSGRYTVTRPLLLGLALSGNDDEALVEALASYGDAVGVGFQVRDDILDLFASSARTGKGSGGDIRAGKRTLLMLRALALADRNERRYLERCLGDPDLDEYAVEECRAIVAESGALASAEALLRTHRAIAVSALEDVSEPARRALIALAELAIDREF